MIPLEYKRQFSGQLLKALKELASKGYKCYVSEDMNVYTYGYIVTSNDNVLGVSLDYYGRGWNFSLQYTPRKDTGTGCHCLEQPVQDINEAIVSIAEREGLKVAKEMKARLYKSSKEFFEQKWNRNVIEVK